MLFFLFLIMRFPWPNFDCKGRAVQVLWYWYCCLQGGVVLVSHDERLIRLICTEVWVCGDLKVRRVEGGIDEYKKLVQQELATS